MSLMWVPLQPCGSPIPSSWDAVICHPIHLCGKWPSQDWNSGLPNTSYSALSASTMWQWSCLSGDRKVIQGVILRREDTEPQWPHLPQMYPMWRHWLSSPSLQGTVNRGSVERGSFTPCFCSKSKCSQMHHFYFLDSVSTGYPVVKNWEAYSWSEKNAGFGIREMWLLTWALTLNSSVTLDKPLSHWKPLSLHLWNGGNKTYLHDCWED